MASISLRVGDVVQVSTDLSKQYTVVSVGTSRFTATDSSGTTYTLATSSVTRIYRNGLQIWIG